MKSMNALGIVLTAPLIAFAVDLAYWDPDGSGLWSEGSRWKEKEAPTVNAYMKDVEAYATDADFSFMTGLTRLRLLGTAASLDLRFDEDHEGEFNTLMIGSMSSTTKATVYKSGTGTFYHKSVKNGCYFSNYFVTNGTLKLGFVDAKLTNMVYGAFVPGQLLFHKNSDSQIKGLVGDGSVSSSYDKQFFLWGDCFHDWADQSPFVYSGALGANMNLSVKAGRHHFTGSTAQALTIRLYGGELGVAALGMTGVSGSVGSGTQVNFLGDATLLYLGSDEETDKLLFFGSDCEEATVDAGARGGVRFSGVWNGNSDQDHTIVLTGSNTTACVVANDMTAAAERRTTIVKRGSGTWDLSDVARAQVTGPVKVEEGVLQVATLAPTNQACALGLATNLGASAAIVLGTAETAGTLAYAGSDYSRAVGRTISLAGEGRLASSATTGSVNFFGVSANNAQGASLVLDGTGTHDGVNDIGGGTGAISLEKTGAGAWSVGGTIDVAKTDVKQGTLVVNNLATRYNYYRFIITELWGGKRMQLCEFGLFDADGNQVNAGLVENASIGKPYDLSDAEIQFGRAFTFKSSALSRLVDGDYDTFLDGSQSENPVRGNPSTWYVFTMKLPADAQPVRFYDIKASQGYNPSKTSSAWNDNHMCNFEARGWRVEASADGRQWDLLDEKYLNEPILTGTGARWYHSDETTFNAADPGYPITANPAVRTISLGTVSVAGGAALMADAPVEISHLVIDADSAGMIGNVTFAANGTLEVVNATRKTRELPLQFADGTNLMPVKKWTLKLTGSEQMRRAIGVADGRLYLTPRGFAIIYK